MYEYNMYVSTWTVNFQMFKMVLEKAEKSEITLPASTGSSKKKKREFQKNIYFCFLDYAKAFDSVDHNKLWKILKEMEILDHLTTWRKLSAEELMLFNCGVGEDSWESLGLQGGPASPF